MISTIHLLYVNFLFFKYIFYLFIERKEGGKREGEKHQCVATSRPAPTGDLAPNPGMCPRLGIELVALWFAGEFSIFVTYKWQELEKNSLHLSVSD